MARKNRYIEENYQEYDAHMSSPKFVCPVFDVTAPNPNHRGHQSYAGSIPVIAGVPFGVTGLRCEIRQLTGYNYSFSYLSDRFAERLLARLDVGNGTHRNRVPDLPLELTSVPTPHFHIYRADGYLIAYPIEGVDYSSEDSLRFDFAAGYDYICSRLLLSTETGIKPTFIFAPDGGLSFPDDNTDPNRDCDFNLD